MTEPRVARESPGSDTPTADAARYLRRMGVDPAEADDPVDLLADGPTLSALGRLVRAHLYSVPFETLWINGSPCDDENGPGLDLSLAHLYEKLVERGYGGYCFELNGLFTWLLRTIGYDAERAAGMVLSDSGSPSPANHHGIVVTLDRQYLVDVGTGVPNPRRPVPLDGSTVTDERGVTWRVVDSDRPDCRSRLEYRGDPDQPDQSWQTRYVLNTEPRRLRYFEATCDYLARAPESPFVGDPVVFDRTPDGYRELSAKTLTVVAGGERTETPVAPEEWEEVLEEAFGINVPADR